MDRSGGGGDGDDDDDDDDDGDDDDDDDDGYRNRKPNEHKHQEFHDTSVLHFGRAVDFKCSACLEISGKLSWIIIDRSPVNEQSVPLTDPRVNFGRVDVSPFTVSVALLHLLPLLHCLYCSYCFSCPAYISPIASPALTLFHTLPLLLFLYYSNCLSNPASTFHTDSPLLLYTSYCFSCFAHISTASLVLPTFTIPHTTSYALPMVHTASPTLCLLLLLLLLLCLYFFYCFSCPAQTPFTTSNVPTAPPAPPLLHMLLLLRFVYSSYFFNGFLYLARYCLYCSYRFLCPSLTASNASPKSDLPASSTIVPVPTASSAAIPRANLGAASPASASTAAGNWRSKMLLQLTAFPAALSL
ncbi:hypothetical protein PoB_003090300 [Plakobranchus ocellatus]|uniref:Yippee domain-containing protein n=1 Tax=Plakobranchus ocellatus TaxID=259542 RepID=A0AAV4ACB3_9GAST|nr:hypothetical protein PoB_003090300 [Plakobranchus ocellatus]